MGISGRQLLGVASLALMLGAVSPTQAQYRLTQPIDAAALSAADHQFQAGQFRQAMEGYRSLLDRAGDGPDALVLAVRLAFAANRAGEYQIAYTALSRQISSPRWAQQDPGLMDHALEESVDAAGMIGRQDEAFANAKQLVDHRVKTQGADSGPTQAARLTVATFLDQAGKSDEAAKLRDLAFDNLKKGDRQTYLAMLNQVAAGVQNNGHLDRAAPLFERLLAEMKDDPESVGHGIVEFNVAVLERDRRRFDKAIEHHVKAIEILERQAGKTSIEAISALGGLGETYKVAGRPAAAVPLMRESLQRSEQASGETDATMLEANNLADALRHLGRYEEAEGLDRRALNWRMANLGPTREATLISRKNLVLDLIYLERFSDASAEQAKLLTALEETRGKDDELVKRAKRDSVRLALLGGDVSQDAVELGELPENAQPTEDNLMLAHLLSAVAQKKGDGAASLKLAKEASRLADAYYGELHQSSLQMLAGLAFAERDQGSPETTAAYATLEKRMRLWAQREYASTNDSAALEQVGEWTRSTVGSIISYSYGAARTDPKAQELFATVLADWKAVGSLDRTVTETAEAQMSEPDKALLAKVRDLQAKSLAQRRGGSGMSDLERELAIAEAALAERVSGLRNADNDERYAAVIARLQPNEAIVDYIVAPVNMDSGIVERVFAMVSRAGGKIWLYDLGALKDVAAPLLAGSNSYDRAARTTLYQALVSKLEPQLEGATRVHFIPDGILNLVPFDGLLDANGRNLVEARDVRIARNARSVSAGSDRAVEPGGVLLVGDVDYGSGSTYAPLPYTKIEVEKIAGDLAGAQFAPKRIEGKAADEAAVRAAAPGNRILHFATHGFFQPVSENETAPLWRAGVALAGANASTASTNPGDDGILHAAELTGWPLSGVELVVFSACDTAQGDRSYVEGLSGLPSALAAAGAKRSLLARWPVNDEGAANFMTRFYENLAAKRSYAVALRQTKLDAIAGQIDKVSDDTWLAFALIENERSEPAAAGQSPLPEAQVHSVAKDAPSGTTTCDLRSAEPC